jgi:pre-mRNA-splicing factor CWC22
VDPEYELHEQQYQAIKKEILGDEEEEGGGGSGGSGSEGGSGDSEDSSDEEGELERAACGQAEGSLVGRKGEGGGALTAAMVWGGIGVRGQGPRQ